MEQYTHLAVSELDQFVFGRCPYPLKVGRGLTLGAGTVYPELNFTLAPMAINTSTMAEVRSEYAHMADQACARAVALEVPGLVIEFELVPDLTLQPEWGAQVVTVLREALDRYAASDGLANALRVTPNDIREFVRPPLMREGPKWDQMVTSFELCAEAGADMLSIESTGGKELHDDALLNADLAGSVFALGVLASADMGPLWDMIGAVATRHQAVPAGDSACGFANTAMALADTRHIPKVWAAVVRVLSVPRSLVAYEHGARGPGKDCAYENVYIKAITGYPMAMEGAEAACAHLLAPGQHRQGHGRPVEQRVRPEREAVRRHGPHRVHGAAGLCHPAHEPGHPGRPGQPAAGLAGGQRHGPRSPGLRATTGRGPTPGRRDSGRAHRLPAYPPGRPGCAGRVARGPGGGRVRPHQARGQLAGPALPPGRSLARGRRALHRGDGGRG